MGITPINGFNLGNLGAVLGIGVIKVIKSASDFGIIDSTKLYYIDGIVDMGSTTIEVPSTGISIIGGTFDVSKLVSSASNYSMFTSPIGGSGNVVMVDIAVEVTGTNSKVYNITDATGFNAIELIRVNYNNCTSLGTITNYRQGLETGTGRFGGKPELTLAGSWLGGYTITTSIVRSLTSGSYTLFKAGTAFVMNSRFRSNMNVDLPVGVSFANFVPANFPKPSTLQLVGMIVTRAGASNADDANYTPNILSTSLASDWRDNVGLPNTFVGGRLNLSSEVSTTISAIDTYYDIAGTYTASGLAHFDSPSSGALRHLGNDPREYEIFAELVFNGTSNNLLRAKVVKWDDSEGVFVDVELQLRRVNSVSGANDSAFFTMFYPVILDVNDYVKLQISNTSGASNVTLKVDSFFLVKER